MIRRRGLHPILKERWLKLAAGVTSWSEELVYQFGETRQSPRQLRAAIRVLETLLYDTNAELTERKLRFVCPFVRYAPSGDVAVQTIKSIIELKGVSHVYDGHVQTAFALVDDPKAVAKLVAVLGSSGNSEPVEKILEFVKDRRILDMTVRYAVAGKNRSLEKKKKKLEAIDAMGRQPPELIDLNNDTSWVERYPESLHSVLRCLAQRCAEAREVAERILGRDFPLAEMTRAEIETVNKKIAEVDPSSDLYQLLLRRLASLQKRLAEHREGRQRPVGKGRLKNLVDKLTARANLEIHREFSASCQDSVLAGIRKFDPDAQVSPRLFQAPYDQLIAAAFKLSGRERKIAIALLLRADDERKNQQPLARENAAFLHRLEMKNVNTFAWSGGNRNVVVGNDQGDTFSVGFETDAMELLLMGFHFGTCLSPGDFNFFSAVTNTIDVNKQVLFCRNKAGKVVGRCLFALTSDGQIKTFRRYLHDAVLNFDDVVDQFALKLAKEMGTSLTSNGSIKTLVAKNWYDDGAVKGGLQMIESPDQTRVGEVLKKCRAETVVCDLVEVLGSYRTVQNNLDVLLKHDAIRKRPELVDVFAHVFGNDPKTHYVDRMRMAVLAFRYQRQSVAFGILRGLDTKQLPRRLKKSICRVCPHIHGVGKEREILELLVAYDIRLARRFLVASRDWDVSNDEQETRPARREALAQIHRQLGRYQLAEKLSVPTQSSKAPS